MNDRRSRQPIHVTPNSREIATLDRLQRKAFEHCSKGSYNMVSVARKGSTHIYGYNRLDRPASTISDTYSDICGVHCELDIWQQQNDLKGYTVFVAGRREKTSSAMPNTRPCVYCSVILFQAGAKNAIYYENGKPCKASMEDLI